MSVTVAIPAALRQYTRDSAEVAIEASTVEETLQKLDEAFPGLKAFILDESGDVRRYVKIFVNERDIRSCEGLMTRLKEGDHVSIVPAVAGGV